MRSLLTITILLLCLQLQAGHLVGGEISYRQISGDTYEITLRMYRDCYAGPFSVQRFDSVAYVSIYHGGTNNLMRVMKLHQSDDSTRLPLIVDVPCLPDPPESLHIRNDLQGYPALRRATSGRESGESKMLQVAKFTEHCKPWGLWVDIL